MTDGEHTDSLRRWLVDDFFVLNTVFLVAASSLALALTSCLWHHIHPEPPSVDQQLPDNPPSIFSVLSSFRISTARITLQTSQQALPVPSSSFAPEQKDRKSTRSKERRRRGKDPFRDLLKSGKKSKFLLKAVRTTDHGHSPPLVDTPSNPSAPGNDTASSTSRSQSPEPAWNPSGLDRSPPRLDPESDDGGAVDTVCNASSMSMITSSGDHHSLDASSRVDAIHSICSHSTPSDSMTSTDTQANVSSASTVAGHACEDAPSSPALSTACTDIRTPQPRNSQAASTSGNRPKVVCPRTRLRFSKIEPRIKSPSLSFTHSALLDNVESPSIRQSVPCLSLSTVPPSNHPTDGVGPSVSTNSRGSTPPSRSSSPFEDLGRRERNTQPLDQSAASAQSQLASMHDALEAARLREEQLRVEAEQASKERDELRWRWNEDAGLWRRREAELQAQIHNIMQQLHAYAAIASFQAQQTSNPFCPPTSPHAHSSPHLQHHPLMTFPPPPGIQTQNSASAPAHVQALLASAPMLTSQPPGFVAPSSAGSYPGKDLSMSPLLWSGLGLCAPKQEPRHHGRRTPDSSASGSSSRGRHRRRTENAKSASDESSLGDWDGMGDGSGDEDLEEEEEDDVFRNDALADAILKRPESIRELGGSVGKRSGMVRLSRPPVHGMGEVGRGGVEERMDALKDPAEKHGFVPPLVDTSTIRTDADTVDRQ